MGILQEILEKHEISHSENFLSKNRQMNLRDNQKNEIAKSETPKNGIEKPKIGNSLPPPAPCTKCEAPMIWIDGYDHWHCYGCFPPLAPGMARRKLILVAQMDVFGDYVPSGWEESLPAEVMARIEASDRREREEVSKGAGEKMESNEWWNSQADWSILRF